MTRVDLLEIYNRFTNLTVDKVTFITFNKNLNQLTFIQENTIIRIPVLDEVILPKRGFEYGLLTPNGYIKLMDELKKYVTSDQLDKRGSFIIPAELGFDIMIARSNAYTVKPICVSKIRVVNITSKLLTRLLMRSLYPVNNPYKQYKLTQKLSKNKKNSNE